ncbi:hypothetical protein CVU37_06905 [candidate division BRC1 bacterium HGW-BRC1-1]|nr:MAG: hypothetical protein CVU37_06905 [candidate division BRC1 bacterium HGW-BRC1-1]
MSLQDLEAVLAAEAELFPTNELARASREVTESYREGLPLGRAPQFSPLHLTAYAQVRMPATAAVGAAVLRRFLGSIGSSTVRSHLDLFSGPGTMHWAAASVLPQPPERTTLLEQDVRFIALGKRLFEEGGTATSSNITWQQARLPSVSTSLAPHDLVTLSYGLGELPPADLDPVVRAAWQLTHHALVLIEPGTPRGFGLIARARDLLIATGAIIVAPCPHQQSCPMLAAQGEGGQKWCHFAERLSRTRNHRRIKGGAVGFEDEKYSYLIACRPVSPKESLPPVQDQGDMPAPVARLVGRPRVRNAGVDLPLCMPDGTLVDMLALRRDKSLFRLAKSLQWGDEVPIINLDHKK